MDFIRKPIEFDRVVIDGQEAELYRDGELVDTIYLDSLVRNFLDDGIKSGLYKEVLKKND